MKKLTYVIGVGALIASIGLSGCATDEMNLGMPYDGDAAEEETSNKIVGSVEEWKVKVSAKSAIAGEVTFAIANFGTMPHEFLVVKTDLPLGEIPLGSNNRFDEDAEGLEVVDEIPEWEPNTAGVLNVKLEPGKYQLLCNIEAHYKNGMYTPFEVLSEEK
ncbi:MAG: hypothetical protein RLZ18_970 [Actinomycetota bacterium]|jgi:uncharacterized cupredoxin-like copper-binding protein